MSTLAPLVNDRWIALRWNWKLKEEKKRTRVRPRGITRGRRMGCRWPFLGLEQKKGNAWNSLPCGNDWIPSVATYFSHTGSLKPKLRLAMIAWLQAIISLLLWHPNPNIVFSHKRIGHEPKTGDRRILLRGPLKQIKEWRTAFHEPNQPKTS